MVYLGAEGCIVLGVTVPALTLGKHCVVYNVVSEEPIVLEDGQVCVSRSHTLLTQRVAAPTTALSQQPRTTIQTQGDYSTGADTSAASPDQVLVGVVGEDGSQVLYKSRMSIDGGDNWKVVVEGNALSFEGLHTASKVRRDRHNMHTAAWCLQWGGWGHCAWASWLGIRI
jgi:hypothetical protein